LGESLCDTCFPLGFKMISAFHASDIKFTLPMIDFCN
jgi:hypothetical protein